MSVHFCGHDEREQILFVRIFYSIGCINYDKRDARSAKTPSYLLNFESSFHADGEDFFVVNFFLSRFQSPPPYIYF